MNGDNTPRVRTSIDCIVSWIFYMVKWQVCSCIYSHEIQSESTSKWIHKNLGLKFNPETLSRAWRHARGQGRVITEEVEIEHVETCWLIKEIDGKSWADVRLSEALQETIDFPDQGENR